MSFRLRERTTVVYTHLILHQLGNWETRHTSRLPLSNHIPRRNEFRQKRHVGKKSEKNNGPRRNLRGFCWCVKSRCSHFKLVPCYSWSIISPYAKFDPNWTKNTEVRNFHFWSISVGRAGRSRNDCRHTKLILCCFCPIISLHTKLHPNRTTNVQIRNFHFWSILVSRAGSSKNGRRHFKLILCCF